MKVKFVNGVVKDCTSPTEQKVYKSGASSGWLLILRLIGGVTSSDLDALLTEDNIKSLDFLSEKEDGEIKTLFTLSDYSKVTSAIIRHDENTSDAYAEIQLTKGV